MPPTVERTGDDLLYRIPAGGSVIWTDETGKELFRVTSTGDAVKVGGVAFDPATLDELATLGGLTASAAELNATDIVAAGTVEASKAVVVDSNKDAVAFRNVTVTNLDAGASGTAGSVDVFPTTASKGKLAITATAQAGDTTVSLVAGAMAAARVITIPDPLADADVLTGKMAAVARTATADGLTTGTIADAGLLQFVAVTAGSDANSIIVLPTPTPGRIVILNVGATGFELRSSAPATIAINTGVGVNAESAIPANSTIIAICLTATAWKAIFLDADSDVAKVEVAAP